MTEILEELVDFAHREMSMHMIYAVVIEGSTSSQYQLEKNGFAKEANLKEHCFARGQYFNEMVFGLVKPE